MVGVTAGTIANCFVWYKVGHAFGRERVYRRIRDIKPLKDFLGVGLISKNYYADILEPGEVVKFKDLGELAKKAIEFDASHLEDTVTGMFVLTKT